MIKKRKPRILLADDEIYVRKYIKTVVTVLGCEIVGEAEDGQETVDLFRELKPDILLLDINMPVKTGEQALEEIMSEFPDSFVIMLTSVISAESVERCLNLGAANYIRKDTSIEAMRGIVKKTWSAFKNEG